MSKIKDPGRKKKLSLKRDRRNTYGQNDKASRKLIPRRKQIDRMAERRGVAQILGTLKGEADDEIETQAELKVATKVATARAWGFEKAPDAPLEKVIADKKSRRIRATGAKARRRAKAAAQP